MRRRRRVPRCSVSSKRRAAAVPRRLHRCSVPRAFWKHLPGRCLSVRWKNTPAFRRTAFHRARRCTGPRKCRNGRAHGGRFLAGRRVAFGGTADPYQPKAVRAAMGSIFRVPVYARRRTYSLHRCTGWAWTCMPRRFRKTPRASGDVSLANCAVIVGNEGRGVRPENIARCGKSVLIPMTGHAESLNAAVAAAILMWEMSGCR